MLTKLGKRIRHLRRRYSRSYLLSRWLGYEVDQSESHEPGLVILQIDGLSRKQFETGLAKGRLPFLRKLIHRGYFERMSFYSGLPSTTPAVQGEIMYGTKCAVPAFQFLHRKTGRVFKMFEDDAAKTIVKEQFEDAEPLLKDGASYSNIYSGGAEEARCCAETTNLPTALKELSLRGFVLVFFLYFFTLLRILWLIAVEIIVAIGDVIRGVFTGHDWRSETKFIASRILVSIVLREWLRIVVKLSIAQGKPIIFGNFLGYDEQAHRRGPSAAFAHWGLKGIDKVIEDIFRSAKRSDNRDYEVIVFADHGQEDAGIYEYEYEETIQEAVKNSLQDSPLGQRIVQRIDWKKQADSLNQRARQHMRIRRGQEAPVQMTEQELAENVIVTALGPLGHIYYPVPVSDKLKADCARDLVERQHVPLVIYRVDDKTIFARNIRGLWKIPDDILQICGENHAFVHEIPDDIACLCEHPDAGDLIISGWDPDHHPRTFVQENGAHGSLGAQETRSFALIPKRVPIDQRETPKGEAYIRGVDLYRAALRFLGRAEKADQKNHAANGQPKRANKVAARPAEAASTPEKMPLRVMTYNTHHCVGLDGKCRPRRIAEVIADLDPEIVGLQEMDVNRHRSGKRDQTLAIATELGMHHHFFPVWSGADERYGLSVLSKRPLEIVREAVLTDACHRTKREARGVIWAAVETEHNGRVHFLNTHLGLRTEERLRQVEALLGEHGLNGLDEKEPVIIVGDFNAGPKSKEMKKLIGRFQCVQLTANGHRPRSTFPSLLPVRRIDYILVSRHFRVESVSVPKNHFTATASDHLPLCADLFLNQESKTPQEAAQPLNHSKKHSEAEPVNASSEHS